MPSTLRQILFLPLAISTALAAQPVPPPTTASTAATRDTSYIDAQGTAYVTRVIPIPPDLSPEAFPVAVYRELLKTYKPSHIILYGTSAGAVLTAEVAVKLKPLGIPLPAALGIFSTLDSFAQVADSQAIYTLQGFAGHLDPPDGGVHDPYYVGSTNPKDPVLSPIYADLHGLPPTLFVTSGRDALLSGTANLHRAYLRDGVDARLVVFDALPHAFWYDSSLPESIEANHIMANFMLKQLPN